MSDVKASIIDFCAELGSDPLMVQGAGGNVSWKDGETLWIKASGMWLADAVDKNIFVPVNLTDIKHKLKQNIFSIAPLLTNNFEMKPSIETVIHALMPSIIVVHLHSIEILSQLVKNSCRENISHHLNGKFEYLLIDYYKPGDQLASAIHYALVKKPSANIIFLKNHGIVIAGDNIEDVRKLLRSLTALLQSPVVNMTDYPLPTSEMLDYIPVPDLEIHRLSIDPLFFEVVSKFWALYPDHVVFLGAKPYTFASWDEVKELSSLYNMLPELVFIKKGGVFVRKKFSKVKLAQLRCYYDVLIRQNNDFDLKTLTDDQVSELLNWEAENYRINLSKKVI